METIISDELKGTLSGQRVVTSAKAVIFSPQSGDWSVCLRVGLHRKFLVSTELGERARNGQLEMFW